MSLLTRLLVIGALALCGLAGIPTAKAATASGCPTVNGDWAAAGPFAVTVEDGGSAHRIFRPTGLGNKGCTRHPVIIWGNGTWTSPGTYAGLLKHLASHGFIVVAAKTSNAGSGEEMLAGIDWITAANARSSSVFHDKVDLTKIGATGHSQGGGGAVVAGADPRVDTVVPIEPGPQGNAADLHGPVLWLAGQNDNVVWPSWVKPRYQNSGHVVAEYGLLAGANHMTPTGDGGGFRGPLTAWFRFWLMGDEQARGEFFGPSCDQCTSDAWAEFLRNARAEAVSGT